MTRCISTLPLLALLGALASCADAPTAAPPPVDDASFAKVSPALDADDFDHTIIRHPDGMETYVNRMNASGAIVGDFFDGTRYDGFLLRGGVYDRISFPGSAWTYAYGINERGDVVGFAGLPGLGQRAYLLSRGEYTVLPAPTGYHTRAFDISTTGVIAGSYHAGTGKWQPAIWDKGIFTPLAGLTAALGADMAEGFGINAQGQVVGHYTVAGAVFPGTSALKMPGFVWGRGRVLATLNYPGSGVMSCGWGIGVHGDVAGHYTDIATPDVAVSGYLWQNGSFRARLVVPGAIGTYPSSITPNGTIAGYAILGRPNDAGTGFIVEGRVGFVAVRKQPGRR
jgi:uncharacterized membrane protein